MFWHYGLPIFNFDNVSTLFNLVKNNDFLTYDLPSMIMFNKLRYKVFLSKLNHSILANFIFYNHLPKQKTGKFIFKAIIYPSILKLS